MRHHRVLEWEQRLKDVFDRIDEALEEKYGHLHALHPSRPRRDTTANREADGLFDVGAVFSPGFGSQSGPGYIVEVRLATLARVPPEEQARIEEETVALLRAALSEAFPGRRLDVVRDGHVLKIVGDLSLGSV